MFIRIYTANSSVFSEGETISLSIVSVRFHYGLSCWSHVRLHMRRLSLRHDSTYSSTCLVQCMKALATYHHVSHQQIYRASRIQRQGVSLDEEFRPEDSVDGITHWNPWCFVDQVCLLQWASLFPATVCIEIRNWHALPRAYVVYQHLDVQLLLLTQDIHRMVHQLHASHFQSDSYMDTCSHDHCILDIVDMNVDRTASASVIWYASRKHPSPPSGHVQSSLSETYMLEIRWWWSRWQKVSDWVYQHNFG